MLARQPKPVSLMASLAALVLAVPMVPVIRERLADLLVVAAAAAVAMAAALLVVYLAPMIQAAQAAMALPAQEGLAVLLPALVVAQAALAALVRAVGAEQARMSAVPVGTTTITAAAAAAAAMELQSPVALAGHPEVVPVAVRAWPAAASRSLRFPMQALIQIGLFVLGQLPPSRFHRLGLFDARQRDGGQVAPVVTVARPYERAVVAVLGLIRR